MRVVAIPMVGMACWLAYLAVSEYCDEFDLSPACCQSGTGSWAMYHVYGVDLSTGSVWSGTILHSNPEHMTDNARMN